ncbi:MAG: hypothetical protein H7143_12095 [Pseudorhodobacter sp.]|nr:hypothetical protein [Rhizobacter sp.]
MTPPKLAAIVTLPWAPVVVSLWLMGCGGSGSNDATEAAVTSMCTTQSQALKASAATTVQLEGCVFNAQWGGAPGVAVHARSADGRTVGTAFTNARGVYVMRVPAQSEVVLDTAVAGPGELSINTGTSPISVTACLLPEA